MIRDKFKSICKEAIVADANANHMDYRVIEPYFQKLILMANDKSNINELKQCFIEIIEDTIDAPYETLAYCMRVLKFEEVLEASRNKLETPRDLRWMITHSDIVHAITDDVWEKAFLWELID